MDGVFKEATNSALLCAQTGDAPPRCSCCEAVAAETFGNGCATLKASLSRWTVKYLLTPLLHGWGRFVSLNSENISV
jgi:hypothetical protein